MAIIAFGPFELDTRSLELRRDGHKVRLRPQPCRVLAIMIARPGQLITRDEIRLAVWPSDVFLRFDAGLNSCLKQIRRALQDPVRRPIYLETLNGRGYRFIGDALVTPDEGRVRPRRLTILPFLHTAGAQAFAETLADDLARHLTRACGSPITVVDATGLASVDAADRGGPAAGVDFVLRGRVRSHEHGIRVTASLVATHDRSHIWADKFDTPASHRPDGPEHLAVALASAVISACASAARPHAHDPDSSLSASAIRISHGLH